MPTSAQQSDPYAGPVYWALMAMGVGALGLCVLWPEWCSLRQLRAAEQRFGSELAALRAACEREERTLDALQADPAAIARLARRELNYRHPLERYVPVAAGELSVRAEGVGPAPEDGVSVTSERFQGVRYNYADTFAGSDARATLAVLSIALLATAAVLLWPRREVA